MLAGRGHFRFLKEHVAEDVVVRRVLLARDDEENIEDTMRGLKLQGDVVSDEKKRQLEVLVAEFGDVFRETPGLTKLTSHMIDTGEATPIRLQAYRIPMHWKEPFKKELDQLLEQGIIEPSRSPWASPTVPVKESEHLGRSSQTCQESFRIAKGSRLNSESREV